MEKERFQALRGSQVLCRSPLPDGGYSREALSQMEREGYILLIDGKPRKKPRRNPAGSAKPRA